MSATPSTREHAARSALLYGEHVTATDDARAAVEAVSSALDVLDSARKHRDAQIARMSIEQGMSVPAIRAALGDGDGLSTSNIRRVVDLARASAR